MLGKDYGGLYKAQTKEERRKRERDQIKFIDLKLGNILVFWNQTPKGKEEKDQEMKKIR